MRRAGLKKSTCSKWAPTQPHICCHGAGAAPILNMLISERRKSTHTLAQRPSGLSQSSPRPSQSSPRASQSSPRASQSLPLPPELSGRRSWGGRVLSSTAPAHKIKPLGILPVCPRCPRKRCHQPLLGPPLPHAPGARMT